MVLDKNIIETWNAFDEVANYYFKGFGNIIAGINTRIHNYCEGISNKEKVKSSYEQFDKIQEFYSKIKFDELKGKKDFYPLFVVDNLLKKYKFSLDEVITEDKLDYSRDIERIGSAIVEVGRLYQDNFDILLNKLRKHNSFKDFKVEIIDYNGLKWDF